MKNLLLKWAVVAAIFCISPMSAAEKPPKKNHPNVLFICIDDLRPDLGCYDNEEVRSPSLDTLASQATIFNNHFVVVPTCGASRASLLRGMLPQSRLDLNNEAGVYHFVKHPELGRPESFVEHFRNNGYYTVGIGKVSHYVDGMVYPYDGQPDGQFEMPNSWDEMLFDAGKWGTGWNAFFGYADGQSRMTMNGQVKPYEKADVPDEDYPDGRTAMLAVEKIGELAERDKPFFLGVGFFKPHLPFNAPSKYWNMVDSQSVSLSSTPDIPGNINHASLHSSNEFNSYKLGDERASLEVQLSDDYARTLRQAYYACIAYVDVQVGKVINALKANGLYENTIVVVWSDHGYQLGDYRVWGKHTLLNRSLRSVLMIKHAETSGKQVCEQVVSSVDIYPTLVELCGLPMPHETDGDSMVALLKDIDTPHWRNHAFSYFNDGISVNTPDYHLIRYFRDARPKVELFDLSADPLETHNIAQEDVVPNGLMELLDTGNTGLYDQ